MPRVNWGTADPWNLYYGFTDAQGVRHGYGLAWVTAGNVQPIDAGGMAQRTDWLLAGVPIQTSDRILVGGCGFGYLIDCLRGRGYVNCWGIDSSAHITANGPTEATNSTLWVKDSFTGGGRVRTALRNLTGDDVFDWVLTESVLESYSDNELAPFFTAAESVATAPANVVHMVYEPPFARRFAGVFNEKSLAQWKAMRPAARWMSLDTGQVL